MTDPLPLKPFTQPVAGMVVLPGSKSITNRALILSALCQHPVSLRGALFSEDTRLMLVALQTLGFTLEASELTKTITIRGCGGDIPKSETTLYVGNAGTVARFLTALLCLKDGGQYHLDGDSTIRNRPMKGLLDALTVLGAEIEYQEEKGNFPFTLKTHGLSGGEVEIDARSSSQLLSALLMVAPLAKDALTIKQISHTVSEPFVQMTTMMMAQFGQSGHPHRPGLYTFKGRSSYRRPSPYCVEPDITAASYFLSLPLVTQGTIKLEKAGKVCLQGDIRFNDVLREIGQSIEEEGENSDLVAKFFKGRPSGIKANFNAFSDTFLTLAAIAPLLYGPTRITGVAHTRKQESDRVLAVATELERLGQKVEPSASELRKDPTVGSLTIHPNLSELKRQAQGTYEAGKLLRIDTYQDHRMAMSFSILGCANLLGHGQPWLSIQNPGCCAKTFPHFFEILDALRS